MTGGGILPSPREPYEVAKVVLEDYQANDCTTLRRWRTSWMRWDTYHWSEIEAAEVIAHVYKRLESAVYLNGKGEARPWQPNKNTVDHVVHAMAHTVLLPESVDAPAWLNRATVPATEVVACTNGLLHVGTRQLGKPTPYFFNRVSVPFDYADDAPPPALWLSFLRQLWPDDPDSIQALQEWFGYVLSGRTDLQKIMLLVGPPRSGKGTIGRVLEALVGHGNAAGPTLASLGQNFGLAPLLGKPLAVVSDARVNGKGNHQIVERLLSISGEDMLTIDRKYREPWTGKMSARFIIMSNELPSFGDDSGAIARRFIILVMDSSYLGREDTRLTRRLLGELPGILKWSLDGLDRLARRGMFVEPESSEVAVQQLHDMASPVSAFIRDKCRTGPECVIEKRLLYDAWREWADANGYASGSVSTFGKKLHAAVPRVKRHQPRRDGRLTDCYQFITLRGFYEQTDTSNTPNTMCQPYIAREGQLDVEENNKRFPVLPVTDTNRTDERCPHGILNGHFADPFIRGAIRCPQCRAATKENP